MNILGQMKISVEYVLTLSTTCHSLHYLGLFGCYLLSHMLLHRHIHLSNITPYLRFLHFSLDRIKIRCKEAMGMGMGMGSVSKSCLSAAEVLCTLNPTRPLQTNTNTHKHTHTTLHVGFYVDPSQIIHF